MAIIFSKAFQKLGLIDIVDVPMFKPNSGGSRSLMYSLTKQSVNETIPILGQLLKDTLAVKAAEIINVEEFCEKNGHASKEDVEMLKQLLENYGSDKSTRHNYYLAYASILKNREKVSGLLEIGMGSNNVKIASNMGAAGQPGASVRAFKDFLPNATVFGADIDKSILFSEDRIQTFFVDQTDTITFQELDKSLPKKLDLIIDDGLHSPNANLMTLNFALQKMKDNKDGYVVIEDIREEAVPLWQVVSSLLNDKFNTYIVKAKMSYMFICKSK